MRGVERLEMMKMTLKKKLIGILCVFMGVISLSACSKQLGRENESNESNSEQSSEAEKETSQIKKCNVSFMVDGEVYHSVTVQENEKVNPPAPPTKSSTSTCSYEFGGWYQGDTEWEFERVVVCNTILNAHWIVTEDFTKEYLPSDS